MKLAILAAALLALAWLLWRVVRELSTAERLPNVEPEDWSGWPA